MRKYRITRNFLIALILVSITTASFAQKESSTALVIKKVTAKDLKSIMDTSSVPMIVNFWATWCGPCIREIPWFDSIITSRNSPVKLLLVSVDFPTQYPQQLIDFVEKHRYKGEVVYLDESNTHNYTPTIDSKWTGEIPASIFINNPKKYYALFNQQLPPKRFEMELDKLMEK